MSEAELIEAFLDYNSEVNTVLFGYVGVISAFLVLSYLVADKLPRVLAAIVLSLFTAASGVMISRLLLLRNDLEALYLYLLQHMASGNLDIPWFGSNPAWAPGVLTVFELGATVGGFFACIGFFVYQRRSVRSAA